MANELPQSRQNDTAVDFQDGLFLPAADLRDMQAILKGGIGRAANLSARDGDRISGAGIHINRDTGIVTLEAGEIFAGGDVRPVASAIFESISLAGEATIGVRLVTTRVTAEDDPTLIGAEDGTAAEGEPRSPREIQSAAWGFKGDGNEGDLYPVYRLIDGTALDTTPPQELSATNQAIGIYDREANGSYIADGCRVTALGPDGQGNQAFTIDAGSANIFGQKRRRQTSLRHKEAETWTTERIDGETRTFVDSGDGTSTITLRHVPMDSVIQVLVEKEITETVTHGASIGAADALANDSVLSIQEVKQGNTGYDVGSDFVLNNDRVDWSPGGDEVATGSSYEATYRFRDAVTPIATTANSITVSGGRDGGEVIVTYTRKLPRVDVICLDQEGAVVYLKGLARRNPVAPAIPAGLLKLAEIENDFAGVPIVINNGTRSSHYDEITKLFHEVVDLRDLLALERLRRDIDSREPVAKHGTFVDPFEDDRWRDAGQLQDAAVFDGILTLPSTAGVFNFQLPKIETLPYEGERVIDQPYKTGCKKINRFASAEPLPARMRINPSEDYWTEQRTEWASPVTRRLTGSRNRTTTTTRVEDERTQAAEFLRAITIAVEINDFGAGENLVAVNFDGVDMTPAPQLSADSEGHISFDLELPGNTFTSGQKLLQVFGQGGAEASATFIGQGTIETRVLQRVTTITTAPPPPPPPRNTDPRGQIVVLPHARARHIDSFWITFCEVGDTTQPVICQIREVDETGYPTDAVIDQTEIDMGSVVIGAAHKIAFPNLPWVNANERVAFILLTPDFNHSVSNAQLGAFDPDRQEHVTVQPYTVGTEIESSTNSTWSAVHDSDLTFSVDAARFTATQRRVEIGTADLVACSELLILAVVDLPDADTRLLFEITRANGDVLVLEAGAPLLLDEWVTETVAIAAVLTGSNIASPRLFPTVQLIAGSMQASATYISRVFERGASSRLPVTLKRDLPSGSGITVSVKQADDAWLELPQVAASQLIEGGFDEATYEAGALGSLGFETAVKIELTGSPAARPRLSDLRAAAIL